MPRGDKSKYTDKQKRMAEHIEEGSKDRGVSDEVAEQRAWATVNAADGGGKLPGGSGRGKSHKKKRTNAKRRSSDAAPPARRSEKPENDRAAGRRQSASRGF